MCSTSSEVVPPKFTQLLKDLEAHDGDKVRFECRVIGHPMPDIRWVKDNKEIQQSKDFQVVLQDIFLWFYSVI